jgi:hypothetical protein
VHFRNLGSFYSVQLIVLKHNVGLIRSKKQLNMFFFFFKKKKKG